MKSVDNFPTNGRRISVQLALLACGLALASVAFIGGGEVLKDSNTTRPGSPLARTSLPGIGVVLSEPDFGSAAADYAAFREPVSTPHSLRVVMPEPDFGSVPADNSAFRQSTSERSAGPIVDGHFGTGPASISAIEGDN